MDKKLTPVEGYLQHLDSIFQTEPDFYTNDSLVSGLPGVTSIVYRDIPEAGFITGFSHGLSTVDHPKWKIARPELTLTVRSTDLAWGQAVGYIANKLRGDCPFCYGDIINFRETVSTESEMDAFFVFAPSILTPENYQGIDSGEGYNITISGLYPFYSDEIPVLERIGLERFWHNPGFDMYDVHRSRIRLS